MAKPTHFKDDPINGGLGDTGSMILSGALAGIIIPAIFASPTLAFGAGSYVIGFGLASTIGFLIGLQKNAENERSVGGFLNRPTGWTQPTGISWWWPQPLGQRLQARRVDQIILARRQDSALGSILEVQTADGGQVQVQVTLTYRVVDVVKAQRLPLAELENRVAGLLDRQVRYFALGFESDSDDEKFRLMNQKLSFSAYVVGDHEYTDGSTTKPVVDRFGKPLTSDVKERCEEIGIVFERAEVHDINPPQEVIDARNKQAAEAAQATQEQEDMGSLRKRTLELMWGTHDPDKITEMKRNNRVRPLMSAEEALRAARAARGDLTDINVTGGGDFTKGEALRASGVRKVQK